MQNEADQKRSLLLLLYKMTPAPSSYGCALDAPISCLPAFKRQVRVLKRHVTVSELRDALKRILFDIKKYLGNNGNFVRKIVSEQSLLQEVGPCSQKSAKRKLKFDRFADMVLLSVCIYLFVSTGRYLFITC